MRKTGEETITNLKEMEIIQRNDFQNFTLDSVLISDFVKINRKSKKILEIGTGCGIMSIILAKRSKALITAIEIEKTMSEVAERNVINNEVNNQIKIVNDDIKNYKNLFKRDEFDIVVTNPPYFEFTGDITQINELTQIAKARHNIDLTLEDIISCSSYLLKNGGSFNMVFRSNRLVEVSVLMKKYNIEPKRIKNVFTKFGENSKMTLIEGIKDGKSGFIIENPIFVYDENGNKKEYIEKLYK